MFFQLRKYKNRIRNITIVLATWAYADATHEICILNTNIETHCMENMNE